MSSDEMSSVRKASTSRRNKKPAIGPPSPTPTMCDRDEMYSIVKEIVQAEFSEILNQFNVSITSTINKELEPIKREMREILESMSFMNNKFEELEKKQHSVDELIKKLEAENISLKNTVGDLQIRIDNLEQQSRSNNIEIQCLPENKNENLYSAVTKLGQTVNCEVKEMDILHCTRIAKVNRTSTRPRSIVVQLASPRLRDQLLASIIKYNQNNPDEKLNSSHFGFAGRGTPVFVAEHLSPTNKALHAAARIKAKEKNYKYVWVRNGRIFVRKSDGAEYVLIKNMNSLNRIV